ncbi:MAG: hypothetical protein ACOCR6_01885 [archaeon]
MTVKDARGTERETKLRLDGIERNLEWLRDNDIDDNSLEAAKRLGLIKGDVQALIRGLNDDD